jgi:hypothetical protein
MAAMYGNSLDETRSDPVAAVLAAAAAPTEPGPLPGEAAARLAFRAAAPPCDRRLPVHSSTVSLKVLAATAVAAGALLTGGAAAAASGSLPGAAQDTARAMLTKIGVSVPGADDSAAGHADSRSTAATPSTPPTGEAATDSTISQLATTTTATGVDKGAEISAAASGGKSQAGQHGSAAGAGAANAPVSTPNTGGTGTADQASTASGDGSATAGTGTADTASGGRSAAGSGNRP